MSETRRRAGPLVLGLALALLASPAMARDVARDLIDGLADCTGGAAPLRLVVAGLPNSQTALTPAEADALRLDVEAMLRDAGAGIGTARDVTLLRGLREGTGADTEALLAASQAGDAAIFIVEPARQDATIAFRLQAITPDAGCKITSDVTERAIAASGTSSVDRVIETALEGLFAAAPDTETLAICPVATQAGHSACAGAVTDALAAAAVAQGQGANRILSGRTLTVSRPDGAACAVPDAETPRAIGRLSTDRDGASRLDLEVRRGAQVVFALPRSRVDLGVLGCDPAVRPLLDHIAQTANRDGDLLDLSASPFGAGERLAVTIELGRITPLHCWVIAPDETAFVTLPVGQGQAATPGRYTYPSDFGLGDIVLDGAFENLFHCFAPASPLPPDLEARWLAAGPGTATLLDATDIADMLDAMRALPGMVEATARITVR